MNVITVTDTDLLHQGSKQNLKAISLQNKVVRDLYLNFPDCIVAGGAPMNHYMGVAARDIDVFCISDETAQKIIQFLDGHSITKRIVNDTIAVHDFRGSSEVQQTNTPYQNNYNAVVYELYGNTPSTSKFAFLFNIVVRAVPASIDFQGRFQIYGLYLETIPCMVQGFCFLEHGDKLVIAYGNTNTGAWYGEDNRAFDKLNNKFFMLCAGATRRGSPLILPFRNNLKKIPFPKNPSVVNLFNNTSRIFGDNSVEFHELTKKGLPSKSKDSYNIVRSLTLLDMPDSIFKKYVQEGVNLFDLRQAVDQQAVEYTAKHMPKYAGFSMSSLRTAYYEFIRGSSRSRPQDWISTWSTAQAVQPSGRADTVVFDEVAQEPAIASRVIGAFGRVPPAPTTSFFPPQGTAAFWRGEEVTRWTES